MKRLIFILSICTFNLFIAQAQTGYVNVEVFKSKPNDIQYTLGAPFETYKITTLETQDRPDTNTVVRVRGYIIPPQSGNYNFYLTAGPYFTWGEGHSYFYLSTDSLVENKVRLIRHNQYFSNMASINLEAGKKYYFETFCDGYGQINNFLKITWDLPGSVIPPLADSCLVPFLGPLNQSPKIFAYFFENRKTFDNLDSLNEDQIDKKQIFDSLYIKSFSINKDFYISKINGYLVPPEDGNYTFLLGANDKAVFKLSTDESNENLNIKILVDSIETDWEKNTCNVSLHKDKYYYFELYQYDSVGADYLKLGWITPSDSTPKAIPATYIKTTLDSIRIASLHFKKTHLMLMPKVGIFPEINKTPWNSKSEELQWYSTDYMIASVNADGKITALNPGTCKIICRVYSDTTIADTLYITVLDKGPYFVKQNASKTASGKSWEDAVELQTLLNASPKGLTIYIAEGIYYPTETIDKTVSIVLNNIRLMGGFDSLSVRTDTSKRDFKHFQTTLSGDIGIKNYSYDNSYHVVKCGNNNLIDGVTISDGRASCSSYEGFPYTFITDDNGGGILVNGGNSTLLNCTIKNNYAWNSGAGLWTESNLNIRKTNIKNNKIEQVAVTNGGIFSVIFNGNGGGLCTGGGTLLIDSSMFFNNSAISGSAMYFKYSTLAKVSNSSFFNNIDKTSGAIFLNNSSTLNFINSTSQGDIISYMYSTANISNSTIQGLLYINYSASCPNCYVNNANIDNSIITNIDTSSIHNGRFTIKNSILESILFGSDTNNIINNSLPPYTQWLDTLTYNGGFTPTMRLKDVPFNPAKSYGNPLYLDSLDQRGYRRTDTVSIGAYQWIYPTGFEKPQNKYSIFKTDTIPLSITILPKYADKDSIYFTIKDTSILKIVNGTIIPKNVGTTEVIIHSIKGVAIDTITVEVKTNTTSNIQESKTSISIYPNPCSDFITIMKDNKGNLKLFNSIGVLEYETHIEGTTTISTKNYSSGVYFIQIENTIFKFMKK